MCISGLVNIDPKLIKKHCQVQHIEHMRVCIFPGSDLPTGTTRQQHSIMLTGHNAVPGVGSAASIVELYILVYGCVYLFFMMAVVSPQLLFK